MIKSSFYSRTVLALLLNCVSSRVSSELLGCSRQFLLSDRSELEILLTLFELWKLFIINFPVVLSPVGFFHSQRVSLYTYTSLCLTTEPRSPNVDFWSTVPPLWYSNLEIQMWATLASLNSDLCVHNLVRLLCCASLYIALLGNGPQNFSSPKARVFVGIILFSFSQGQ